MIPRQTIEIFVEVNIVFTLMGKGFVFDPMQQIGQHVIDDLRPQESCERKHALVLQVIDALLHQLLPGIAVELMQGITIKIKQGIH